MMMMMMMHRMDWTEVTDWIEGMTYCSNKLSSRLLIIFLPEGGHV
jgi:hypothetical protein